ncbi:MAG: hypothetical protein VX726_10745 [Planctomycetota bacterium]|nr:hypothetical protein [Planctomycetota bacterium]
MAPSPEGHAPSVDHRPFPAQGAPASAGGGRLRLVLRLLGPPALDLESILLASSGCSVILLAVALEVFGAGTIEVPLPVLGLLLGAGVVLLGVAGRRWHRACRIEISRHLLRTDRCGCCGHALVPTSSESGRPGSPAIGSWHCPECGSRWSRRTRQASSDGVRADRSRGSATTKSGRGHETRPAVGPRPLLGEIAGRLAGRERWWLVRCLGQELVNDRTTNLLVLGGGSMVLLAVVLGLVKGGPVPAPIPVIAGLGGIGLLLLVIAAARWRRLLRSEVVQYLLRLDRCGCCAHPLATTPGELRARESSAVQRRVCPECGALWGAVVTFECEAESRRKVA